MKRFLSALRPLGMGGGFIIIWFLFTYTWKIGPVASIMKLHPSYITVFSILFAILCMAGAVYWESKRVRSLPEQERKIFKLRAKKKLPFTLVALVVFFAILFSCTIFIPGTSLPSWLKMNFPYILTFPFLIVLSIDSYIVDERDERKLKQITQEKETANLKLRSIRSQLNPHFMFNALTSIQNLMNKNDIPAANHYLTLFADLTRKVLNTGERDLISLADELKIQDDYLQMEQLRFGFKYNISVGGTINKDNTEIPAMLLQPFVENAVKHGMPANGQNGVINVTIDKQDNNLILAVADNGKGFDRIVIQNQTTSFGLKLSEQRIELLNQLHKDQPVTLNIDSTPTGTTVTIMLINLFS